MKSHKNPGGVKSDFLGYAYAMNHFYLVDFEASVDNGITTHLRRLGAQELVPGKWLLKSSMDSTTLTVALAQSQPDRLEVRELAGEHESDVLRAQYLGAKEAATEPPLAEWSELRGEI